MIYFETSKFTKSTRSSTTGYGPGCPASVPFRHTIVNSVLATQHSLK
ncbi:MAG: hypothetical protein KZQ66_08290 [Candidatus Thiodiazotropha sp. (ex Lucinoma aequizonata)]|nr:hypothetical protein [Candidatus Thiodiazotropha sp. (ex Lucinoma aequizonata)]MCU7888237.1 hypothetical protein [Candidatus Thiodiazotropha sp. (ex Lucinoma aequizonata)]MCU7895805.1 hypothetical protein [Candidatus Thiodiazotropha sp. (ex Lucinoma aequizonata)]MCU7900439.1 hypothetical protein [Candidatus Thiodiazotropha sp. (ex Lucinoma aequizonata)]MCU7901992.1 hypothetical protein [Candidatus Thiodiazotropha sp. (ex Lucinoma aequizonata)]